MKNHQRHAGILLGVVVLFVGFCDAVAYYSRPFKDVARDAHTIIRAKCQAGENAVVDCYPDSALRGVVPIEPVRVSQLRWKVYELDTIEKGAHSTEYFLILTSGGTLGCLADLPILGDCPVCIIPFVDGILPSRFRRSFDGTDGGALGLDQVLALLQLGSGEQK